MSGGGASSYSCCDLDNELESSWSDVKKFQHEQLFERACCNRICSFDW